MRRALLILALASLAAGCGGSSASLISEADAAPALKRAAAKTMDARSAKVALKVLISAGDEASFEGKGSGVTDYEAHRSRMTLDLSDFAGAGVFSGAPADLIAEIIYTRDLVYMRMPALGLPESRPWAAFDVTASMSQGSSLFSAPDPDELLRFVEATGEEVEVVGDDTVGGAKTTHVRAEIDVDDLSKVTSAERRPGFEAYTRKLEGAGVQRFPLDVWLDEDGRIRRLSVKWEFSVRGQKADTSFSLELSDFGKPVRVELPPDSKVSIPGS